MNVKRKFANALIEICEHKPLDDVTVSEIAQKANLTRQVFYKYFMDKYELANWIQVDDYYSTLQNRNIQSIDWFTYVEGWLSLVRAHKSFYQNMYYSVSQKEFQRLYKSRIVDFYTEIIRCNMNTELNEELLFCLDVYCFGGCEKICEWILTGMKTTPKQLCNYLYTSMPKCIQDVLTNNPFPQSIMNDINDFTIEKIKKV